MYLMFCLALFARAETITFSTHIQDHIVKNDKFSEGYYRKCVLQIFKLPIYTSTTDDVKRLMKKQGAWIRVRIEEFNKNYSILGFCCPSSASYRTDASSIPAFFFLFHEKRLIATAYTIISTNISQTMSFISTYGEELIDWDITNYLQTPKSAKNLSWDMWLSSISVQIEKTQNLSRKGVLNLFLVKNALVQIVDIRVYQRPKAYVAYIYINIDDANHEKPYFFQTYNYVRRAIILYEAGNIRSICNCLEIADDALPEDGTEDPLDMKAYILIKESEHKKSDKK